MFAAGKHRDGSFLVAAAVTYERKVEVLEMNIQDMILTLQKHWSSQGCVLMQAYDVEKGAGTMSPYTFLRSIGPEPWKVAYVEPSRRPADE